MRRHAPFGPTDLNVSMWGGVVDVIKCAKFFENPSKGLGAVRPRKIAFPIEIVHRPYNSVGTTVPNCDYRHNLQSLRYGFPLLVVWVAVPPSFSSIGRLLTLFPANSFTIR